MQVIEVDLVTDEQRAETRKPEPHRVIFAEPEGDCVYDPNAPVYDVMEAGSFHDAFLMALDYGECFQVTIEKI